MGIRKGGMWGEGEDDHSRGTGRRRLVQQGEPRGVDVQPTVQV